MPVANGDSRKEILRIVQDTLTTVCSDAVAVGTKTCLLGSQAILDSVGFVTLLVSLEQNLGSAVDLASSFMEHGSAADEHNPFRTVGSLVDHIHQMISKPTVRHNI